MGFRIHKGLKLQRQRCPLDCTKPPGAFLAEAWGKVEQDVDVILLAFADDGQTWGRLTQQGLFVGHDAAASLGRPLRWETLQRAHLFAETREIRIWRECGDFKGAVLTDGHGEDCAYYDEEQILFGTRLRGETELAGDLVPFTPVEDLAGQWHAPPIRKEDFARRALRLKIRHYLYPDRETGMLKNSGSRILSFYSEKGAQR